MTPLPAITSIYDPRYPHFVDPKDPNSSNPTAQAVFGPTPWIINAGGYNALGGWSAYQPYYFATQETADKLAQMLGGTVVDDPYLIDGPFAGNHPARLIQVPGGTSANAGILANKWVHSWDRDYIAEMVSGEIGKTWEYPPVPAAPEKPPAPSAPPPDAHVLPIGYIGQRLHADNADLDGFAIGFTATSPNGSQWVKGISYTPFGVVWFWECVKAGAV